MVLAPLGLKYAVSIDLNMFTVVGVFSILDVMFTYFTPVIMDFSHW